MITLEQYFTNPTTGEEKPHTPQQYRAAAELLRRREALRVDCMRATGMRVKPQIDPDTGSEISGKEHGSGGGGFRAEDEEGSKYSSHKILYRQNQKGEWLPDPEAIAGAGLDDYDPGDQLDNWISTFDREGGARNEVLERHGLYREAPAKTPGWCHLTTRAPRSGRRTFEP